MATEQTLIRQGVRLLELYVKLHQEKYGRVQSINRHKEKYRMKDVVESVGLGRAMEIMDYYFRTSRNSHPIDWFVYNFDKLDMVMKERVADEKKKAAMRAETAARVAEWERRQRESRSEID